jgi:pSer/pThr/pTyr-binding forkhead associated (FHA) protein
MEAKLVVVGGEARVSEVQLKLPMIIGRGRNAGLTLPHPLVSRQHCEIYEKDNRLLVNDLGSLNGTFVGEKRITEPTPLLPGELLTVGTVTFRAVYEIAGAAEPVEFNESEETGTEIAGEGRTVRALDKTVSTSKAKAPSGKNGSGKPAPPRPKPTEDVTEAMPVEEDEPLEVAEEVEEVEEVAEIVEAEHDTKDASAGNDDDDLQAFLRGLG